MPDTSQNTQIFRFDEMAVLVNDKINNPAEAGDARYVGLEHIDPESLKIRRWGSTSDVEASKLLFKSGDIIFGKRRVYQRKLAVPDFDGICSAHAMVLRAKSDVVRHDFLPFFMQSDIFMDRALEISVGSLSPTINWKALAAEEFALPSLEQQSRITEVLISVESSIRLNFEAQARLRKVGVAVVDHWIESIREQGLSPVPLSKLVCREPTYGLNAPATEFQETLPRYLRITDIDDDGKLSDENMVSVQVENPELYKINSGDLLFARTGTVGKVYMATGTEHNTVYAGYLIRFSLDTDLVDPRYVFAYTRSSHYWSWVRANSRVGVQPNINAKEYGALPLWIPENRSDQKILLKRFDDIQEASQSLSDRFTGLVTIKKKVMSQISQ